jgi:hypothetical protein
MTVKEQCLAIVQDMIDGCNTIGDERYLCASNVLQMVKFKIETHVQESQENSHTYQIIEGEGIDN